MTKLCSENLMVLRTQAFSSPARYPKNQTFACSAYCCFLDTYIIRPRLRRSDRLMKKRRVSHPDEEDPGAVCALLGAMKLNVWGGQESYSISLEQEKGKSGGKGRAKRARKRRV